MRKIRNFIDGLIEWSTRNRGDIRNRDMGGIVSRNYRTWIGHTIVTTGAVAAGKLIATVVSLVAPAIVGTIILALLVIGANAFYGWREFGPNGNYREAKGLANSRQSKDKRLDSIGDALFPFMFSMFSVFNLSLIGSVGMFVILFGSMVFLKSEEDL